MYIKQFNLFSFVEREIIVVRSLKSNRKKLVLTLFYYDRREILLGNSKKIIRHIFHKMKTAPSPLVENSK